MKKKIFLSLIIIGFALWNANVAKAEEQFSKLVFEYVSIDSLSENQEKNIIKQVPKITSESETEHYTFVYQPVKKIMGYSNVNFTEDNHSNFQTISEPNKVLPQTNFVNNINLNIIGIILIILFFVVLLSKKRNKKIFFLFFVGFGVVFSIYKIDKEAYAISNNALLPTVSRNVIKGTDIDYEIPEVRGYVYIGYLKSNTNDSISERGNVTASYVDETGVNIVEPVSLSGKVGTEYMTDEKTFANYEFVKVTGNPSGLFSDKVQNVVYHYKKNVEPAAVGKVLVQYVDTTGNNLVEPTILTGDIGSPYNTEKKEIANYEFVKVTGNTTGLFSDEVQNITYIYKIGNGSILFNLRVKDLSANNQLYSVPEYIKKVQPNVNSIEDLQFIKLDDNWNSSEPVEQFRGADFSTLLNGNNLTVTGQINSAFLETSDIRKDVILSLIDYKPYVDNQNIGVKFTYIDNQENKKEDTMLIFEIESQPNDLQEVIFLNSEKKCDVLLTVGFVG